MKRVWKGWGEEWQYMGKMNYIQTLRYKALVKDGLQPYQAKHFVFYRLSSAYMRRFRRAIRNGMAGRSQRNAWALWRRFYNDAVEKYRRGDRGGYIPPKKPYAPNKPHKKLTATGEIDYSHTAKYERDRRTKTKVPQQTTARPSGNREDWMRQLEKSIEATDDPQRKAQLRQQLENLRRTQR